MAPPFHGIVIQEGLRDVSILDSLPILGRSTSGAWTLLRVRVEGAALRPLLPRVQVALGSIDGVPFYAHFYRPGELVIVYPDAISVVGHGLS